MCTAADAIAERIRTLGASSPGTFKEFTRLASIKESDELPNARGMIRDLVEGNESVIRTARTTFANIENDEATADLVTQRIQVHEKTAWMLRSLLED